MQLQECPKRGEVVCKYGEIGDRFYVVLRGIVGIKVPTEVTIPDCEDYLEVLNVVQEHLLAPIIKMRDPHSRLAKQLLDIIPFEQIEKVENLVELLSLVDHYMKEEQGKLGQMVAQNVSIFAASNTDTSGCFDSEDASFQRCMTMDDELAERMDACQKRINFLADYLSKVSA